MTGVRMMEVMRMMKVMAIEVGMMMRIEVFPRTFLGMNYQ